MWDGRKYSLIPTVIQTTNVVVSEIFYCIFPKKSFYTGKLNIFRFISCFEFILCPWNCQHI